MKSSEQCPLCGKYSTQCCVKRNCWCWYEDFPKELTDILPSDQCICKECLIKYKETKFEIDGFWEGKQFVFSKQFLSNRGYCCENGCRNCPYGFRKTG